MIDYKSEIRKIFEMALLYNIQVKLSPIFPSRATRDQQQEAAYEEFLTQAIVICKRIELPINATDNTRMTLSNLFSFAAYVGAKHPEQWNVAVISQSIPDAMLLCFAQHSWDHEPYALKMDLTSQLAKLILNANN